MLFDESIDVDNTMTNGGGGINPDVLPRNGSNGCTPVYPWMYPRVNNIFEVSGQCCDSEAVRSGEHQNAVHHRRIHQPSLLCLIVPKIAAPGTRLPASTPVDLHCTQLLAPRTETLSC